MQVAEQAAAVKALEMQASGAAGGAQLARKYGAAAAEAAQLKQ